MKKLFKVDFKGMYGDEVYITANGYDEAANKALKIKLAEEKDKPLIDEDGSLTVGKKEKKISVRSVGFLNKHTYP